MRLGVAVLGAGLAVAVLCAASAQAQDPRTRTRSYLEHAMAAHEQAGYARDRTIPDLEVPLNLDRPHLWSIYLLEGVNYRVYAACDDDCTDVDMEVYGADGAFIERDASRDDTPFVQVTPTQTGRHYVRVWLYACSAEPCFTAARVMSGGTPAARETGGTQ